jgi:hypothetical protein
MSRDTDVDFATWQCTKCKEINLCAIREDKTYTCAAIGCTEPSDSTHLRLVPYPEPDTYSRMVREYSRLSEWLHVVWNCVDCQQEMQGTIVRTRIAFLPTLACTDAACNGKTPIGAATITSAKS